MLFLPLKVITQFNRKPTAVLWLLLSFVCVFVLELFTDLSGLYLTTSNFEIWQPVTSSFVHAGLFHLAINGLLLWVFGSYLENCLGTIRFLALYVAGVVFADIVCLLLWYGDNYSLVGASGGVYATFGMLFAAQPRTRVKTFIWVIIYFAVKRWPLWALLVVALVGDAVSLMLDDAPLGVAAHLSGLAFGLLIGLFLRSQAVSGTSWDLSAPASRDYLNT